MERRHFPRHETDPECVPMSPWQAESFPTCNGFHETGIESLVDNSLRLLSTSGSWRDAWRLKAPIAGQKDSVDNIIMKTINQASRNKHTFQDRYFEFSRVDSLAMEKLTSSPYVMNIYGHCGMSVMTERGGEQLGHVARRISSRERVKMAIKVAEGLVDVHGIGGGDNASLVHNDINLNNIFVGGNFRTPLLNDFNIAVLLMKDRRSGQACAFTGHYPNPQWKSPEEQVSPQGGSKGQLNEKVDIYAVGNLLFTFLTGKAPWGHLAKHHPEELPKIGRAKMTEGLVPPVPDEYLKSKDPYLRVLRQAMDMCFQFRPEDRPSAKELAQFLEEAKVEADQSDIEFGRKRRKRK
ncbi:hypothetical protein THAOC_08682 [Thalassiosira oceanica]|uniref:Protein kinase domain-containing protein n=1 Tax=Thalassiosira oceanica TaxID=159749 RepID=K0THL9_THAOC|nr:hypothetical protein THAOC_08682 [Thalassiosira oceanica]|eukprot:EJK70002.1 hypothetical protein THAOC_08682 [Thalassiosira oceanica]